jgi:hypothetical protein
VHHQYTQYHTAPDTADKFTPNREREQNAHSQGRYASTDTHQQHYQNQRQVDTARRYQNSSQDHSDDEQYAQQCGDYDTTASGQQPVRGSDSSVQMQRAFSQSVDRHDQAQRQVHGTESAQRGFVHGAPSQSHDQGVSQYQQVPRSASSDAHATPASVTSSRPQTGAADVHPPSGHAHSAPPTSQQTHNQTVAMHGIAEQDEGSSFFASERDPNSPLESVPGDTRQTPEQHPGAPPSNAAVPSSAASNLPQRVLFDLGTAVSTSARFHYRRQLRSRECASVRAHGGTRGCRAQPSRPGNVPRPTHHAGLRTRSRHLAV